MKIMFIVYHDINTEARTQEILKSIQELGETYFVSFSKPNNLAKCTSLSTGKSKRNYITFIRDSIKYLRQIKPEVVILHDNYTAIILKWLLMHKKKPFIIYDSSELYIDLKPKGLKQKLAMIMQYFEKKYLKYADLTIAANFERAQIMKEYFKLKDKPLIFDNMHRIDDHYNETECKGKYAKYFSEDKFTLIYAGGISKGRMTYSIANAVGKLGKRFNLIVLGNAKKREKELFNEFIQNNKYDNIIYLGFIPRADFRYLLRQAKVSVSAFLQDTNNNKYCASGKVYESLFEGTPILTSDNPPLKRLCLEHGVGISTNNFKEGILSLEADYYSFCKNVSKYITQIDYEGRISQLTKELGSAIGIYQ